MPAAMPGVALDQASLEALAAASGRPRECSNATVRGDKGRNKKPSVWRRARLPQLVAYCDFIAKAHAVIDVDPQAALELAEKAEAAWPAHAGALVTQARALLDLGKTKESLEKLEAAKAVDKLSVEEPKAMHAHARALIRSGRIEEGAELYRTMVPRGSLLSAPERARLLLEAAFASMADAGRASKEAPGPNPVSLTIRLGEAIAFISEARSSEGGSLTADILFAAALIHERAGDGEKSRVALAEANRTATSPQKPEGYVADPIDALAMKALALESANPSEASVAWTQYLDGAKVEPFAAAARARAAALKGPRPSGKAKRP